MLYLFHGFEIEEAEFEDVIGLVTEDFSCEIVENIWETLGNWEFLDVLARHS